MTNPPGPPPQGQPPYGPSDRTAWARPPVSEQPTQSFNVAQRPGQAPPEPPKAEKKRRLRLGDPLTIVLILIIVFALAVAGLLGAELYARHEGTSRVASATECLIQDKADVSFAPWPPFLMQRINSDYRKITITTAGNQIKQAKGMKAQVIIDDVSLEPTANSKGKIGALDATVTWTSDGIKQTVQDAVPLLGGFLSGVKTDASAGTIELEGGLASIIAKPSVENNKIKLEMVSLTGLGFMLPKESVQPMLDTFTDQLANNFPLGIHADSLQVTDSGVTAHFSTRNATIPEGESDPCFANL
jgi:hypothetical protein